MADVVRELEERAESQAAPVVDGVTLASVHAAKGLEWPVVFVVGASDGLLPISMAKTPAEVEEERRLFYVALTRARDLLTVSWAAARTPGARGSRKPSRFLDGVLAHPDSPAVWAARAERELCRSEVETFFARERAQHAGGTAVRAPSRRARDSRRSANAGVVMTPGVRSQARRSSAVASSSAQRIIATRPRPEALIDSTE